MADTTRPISRKVKGIRDMARAQREAAADDEQGKVRENRLRRAADRQGLRLEKSRRRDPRALDFGTYMLTDPASNTIVVGDHQRGYGMTLSQIEKALDEGAIGYDAASEFIDYDNAAEARGEL